MKMSTLRKMLGVAVLALITMLAVSSETMGQGRSRRAVGNKCAKFVNCHDARDGRWDGRGPNRQVGITSRIFRRNRRNRDYDTLRRRRHRDRDHNRNRDWRRR